MISPSNTTQGKLLSLALLFLLPSSMASAEVTHFSGSDEALPHEQYINVVSQVISPVEQIYIKSVDGAYVAAAMRKPAGEGPFPAIVMFHGAPGGRGMEQLVGWSRGDHGGPVWERFLQEGYVVVVADYRGGAWNSVNSPAPSGGASAIADGIEVVEHVKSLEFVRADEVSLYGVSLGGNLVMYLASLIPELHAVVAGAPFPIWFLGAEFPSDGSRPDYSNLARDTETADANIAPIDVPLYILVGTADPLLPVSTVLHEELEKHGKNVRMEIYEHGYHDFVLGPQGHDRGDLPRGEFLLQGALDALERTIEFVKSPQ